MINGGLAEVTVLRVDDHRITVKMGNHRVFDIVDGVAEHKSHRGGDLVLANPRELVEKLTKLLKDPA